MKQIIVIKVNTHFVQTAVTDGKGGVELKLCENPRDAFNWNVKQNAMDCAQWLKQNMFSSVGVYVQTYALFDDGRAEVLQ